MKADFAQRREVGYYGCFMNADIISLQKVISSQQVVLPQQQQMKQTSNKKSSKTNSKQKVSPQIILRRNFQRQQPLFATR